MRILATLGLVALTAAAAHARGSEHLDETTEMPPALQGRDNIPTPESDDASDREREEDPRAAGWTEQHHRLIERIEAHEQQLDQLADQLSLSRPEPDGDDGLQAARESLERLRADLRDVRAELAELVAETREGQEELNHEREEGVAAISAALADVQRSLEQLRQQVTGS
jgi:archaellum component FlaC